MKYEIDLKGVRSKIGFHEKIEETLPCPGYYGRNLDALYDLLTEGSEPWELNFLNWEEFAQCVPGYEASLREMCMEAMVERSSLTVTFEK
jgi:ribonuclease inhibitor